MSTLDEPTRHLLEVAAALNDGPEERLVVLMREASAAGTSATWLEELVLESSLFVGFPKALVAAVALRRVHPQAGRPGDAADYAKWPDWLRRGEVTGRRIYGKSYDRLMENLEQLHPALKAWVVLDGYGRAISREALDLGRRELCAVAMLVAQGVPRQLHSHLRGALNTGNTPEQVAEALEIASAHASKLRATEARQLWDEIRVH